MDGTTRKSYAELGTLKWTPSVGHEGRAIKI
jgi:hypothetical protein